MKTKKIIFLISIILLFTIWKSGKSTNEMTKDWKIQIVDIKSGKEIGTARFVITDIKKEFNIDKKNNKIYIPEKIFSGKEKYPYGYTTMTISKGYFTRIDHNLKIGVGGGEMKIELTPMEPMSNKMVDEVFHDSSNVELAEFLDYYNADPYK